MKKRLSTILATLLMTVTLIPFAPVHAKAASADVTRQMAGNRQIKDISKKMTAYTTAMNISVWSTTKPVKMKLNDNQKLSIAVFVRYKSASVSKIKSSKKNKNQAMFVCSSDSKFYKDPYMYCGGDFGDMIPDYKIKKVVRTGKNTYTVTTQNRYGIYGEKGRTNIGTTTLKLKKTATGYVVKGISYQYNGR